MASQISICNQALAELPAAPIASISEASLEARECNRVYDQVISEMLEGPHDWSFAKRRVALVQTTNDRPGEWLYAYQAPSSMGKPLRVLPTLADATSLVWPALDAITPIPYVLANGIIYTNQVSAIFEYSAATVEAGSMSAAFARAVSLEMASRMAMPLKKSRELKGDLVKQAEVQKERAMADDANRSPQRTPDYVSDVEIARLGIDPGSISARGT